MKKKISLLLCLIFAVLTMAACGTDPTKVDYYGTSYNDLQENAQGLVTALVSMSDEEMEYYKDYSGSDITFKLIDGWQTVTADLGAYQGLGSLEITKANGTVTVDQYVEFEVREVDVTYVFDYDYAEEQLMLTDVNVDLVYSLGEKMAKAGLNTLMGMGTVFCVLILISLIIYCFRFISVFQNRGKKNKEEEKAPETVEAVVEEAPLTDDLELVAVISAAIAASTGTSTDSFVVRSINRR